MNQMSITACSSQDSGISDFTKANRTYGRRRHDQYVALNMSGKGNECLVAAIVSQKCPHLGGIELAAFVQRRRDRSIECLMAALTSSICPHLGGRELFSALEGRRDRSMLSEFQLQERETREC
jgi:hypothetical protein